MPTLASDVMDTSRAALNDTATNLWTNTVLLPYLKIANDDLSDALIDNGATVQKTVDAEIALAEGDTEPTLPADIIMPIELFEKNSGQDDIYYQLMTQRAFTPNGEAGVDLLYWDWREQVIYTPGATQDKVVRLRYTRLLTTVSTASSPIEMAYAKNYLAYHTAALGAWHIGKNKTEAADLEAEAILKLAKILKREVKQNQGNATRRRSYSSSLVNRFRRN